MIKEMAQRQLRKHRDSEESLLNNCYGNERGMRRNSSSWSTSSSSSSDCSVRTGSSHYATTNHGTHGASRPLTHLPELESRRLSVPSAVKKRHGQSQIPSWTAPQLLQQPPSNRLAQRTLLGHERYPNVNHEAPMGRHCGQNTSTSGRRWRRQPLLQRKNLICISLLALLTSVLAAGLLVLIMVQPFHSGLRENRSFQENSYQACIKCDHLKQNMDDNEFINNLTQVIRQETVECCAKTSSQLSALLTLILKQQKRVPRIQDKKDMSQKIPSAQIHFESFFNSNKDKGLFNMMINSSNPRLKASELVQNVNIKSTYLSINVTGWYYVYSNIYYSSADCKNYLMKVWHHQVHLFSVRYPSRGGILLKTAYTCCEDCKTDKETSFTGGIFELFEEDTIYTTVTNNSTVVTDKNSFLGLMMLGDSSGADN